MFQKSICSPEGTLNHHKTKCKPQHFPKRQKVYFLKLPGLTEKNLTGITSHFNALLMGRSQVISSRVVLQISRRESLGFHPKTYKSHQTFKTHYVSCYLPTQISPPITPPSMLHLISLERHFFGKGGRQESFNTPCGSP